ncbi:MAG: SCO family protein [Deltaproteobacteria bacterium]|nr:SCO family protein [Deltaproteobacteria bacterium]
MRRAAGWLLVALVAARAAAGTPSEPPGDSLYRLSVPLVDQAGRAAALDLHRGRPTIVSLFYASCPNVCPLLVAAIQRIDAALADAERARTRVLLVSLDPQRDTPAALEQTAARLGVDRSRWTLARAAETDVRRLAAALGVQYRKLPDGEFNHSTVLALLDRDGRIVARSSVLGRLDEEFVERLRHEAR